MTVSSLGFSPLHPIRSANTAQKIASNALSSLNQQGESTKQSAKIMNGYSAQNQNNITHHSIEHAQKVVGRLHELAIRANDSTLKNNDRTALNNEAKGLQSELNQISFHNADGNQITDPVKGLDLSTQVGAEDALTQLSDAQTALDRERAIVGADSAATTRQIELATAEDSTTSEIQGRRNNESFVRNLQDLAMTPTDLAIAAAVHRGLTQIQSLSVQILI